MSRVVIPHCARLAAPRARFELELLDHLTRPEGEHTVRTLIAWSRYAEAFDHGDRTRKFRLLGT